MPTVSGKWKWNDTLPAIETSYDILQDVNYSYLKNNEIKHGTSILLTNYSSKIGNVLEMHYGTIDVPYNGDSGNWQPEYDKIIDFGSEPKTVSQDFYDYLTANAEQVYTVSGVWVWNDGDNIAESDYNASVNFTSNGQSYSSMVLSYGYNQNPPDPARVDFSIKYDSTEVLFATYPYQGSWSNQAYRTVDFGSTEQEVSEEFYNYLTTNAVQQEEPVVPATTKTVSSDNLARFKQKCDETYAAIGNIPTVSTELVNLGTLSTSGTLTTDQVTQIGTTTVGVTARASVSGVTRFYERVNISSTTAMLVSADDDALHVLTVNLSTRAYTLSDVALGGGGSGPDIPTPTTADNGKVLGVANGAYALQEAGGGVTGYTVTFIGVSSVGDGVLNVEYADGTAEAITGTNSLQNVHKIYYKVNPSGITAPFTFSNVFALQSFQDSSGYQYRQYVLQGNCTISTAGGN